MTFGAPLSLAQNDAAGAISRFLDQAEMEFDKKSAIDTLVRSGKNPLVVISQLQTMGLDEDLVKCISELLTAQRVDRQQKPEQFGIGKACNRLSVRGMETEMKIVVLDRSSVGEDVSVAPFESTEKWFCIRILWRGGSGAGEGRGYHRGE